ncbi:hypothetical protein BLNAU_22425 [Blattamonas nauphoetae]|uniref:Uncharacterized protein n=1 Tax=Blattamonas nauphoetae TaxID=2049346 RepID=A0ABQ9WT36_9EUKA|nr:hypothetical protein BLNAU_22425 [Blattamonas nauphoetae]
MAFHRNDPAEPLRWWSNTDLDFGYLSEAQRESLALLAPTPLDFYRKYVIPKKKEQLTKDIQVAFETTIDYAQTFSDNVYEYFSNIWPQTNPIPAPTNPYHIPPPTPQQCVQNSPPGYSNSPAVRAHQASPNLQITQLVGPEPSHAQQPLLSHETPPILQIDPQISTLIKSTLTQNAQSQNNQMSSFMEYIRSSLDTFSTLLQEQNDEIKHLQTSLRTMKEELNVQKQENRQLQQQVGPLQQNVQQLQRQIQQIQFQQQQQLPQPQPVPQQPYYPHPHSPSLQASQLAYGPPPSNTYHPSQSALSFSVAPTPNPSAPPAASQSQVTVLQTIQPQFTSNQTYNVTDRTVSISYPIGTRIVIPYTIVNCVAAIKWTFQEAVSSRIAVGVFDDRVPQPSVLTDAVKIVSNGQVTIHGATPSISFARNSRVCLIEVDARQRKLLAQLDDDRTIEVTNLPSAVKFFVDIDHPHSSATVEFFQIIDRLSITPKHKHLQMQY